MGCIIQQAKTYYKPGINPYQTPNMCKPLKFAWKLVERPGTITTKIHTSNLSWILGFWGQHEHLEEQF